VSRFPVRGSHQLRKGRWSISGAYYFLTTSTYGQRPIFSNPDAVQVLFDTFNWLEAQGRITWICVIVMPEHIHTVIQLSSEQTLAQIMRSFKSFTARQINELLGQRGSLWQEQYYDHCIRKDEALRDIVRYCYENPVRRGLVEHARDYPYWRCKFEIE
jgi:REP element-mobilizing transposase RayT